MKQSLLGTLVREAHAQDIKVDAWLCDFVEGASGAAYREHPEWAQLNPGGGTTATETLGAARRPYPYVWMCPARRPGYTDQWLLPMIEEIATNYAIDSIHHDYVRYPGDVAPDTYCFCDYCLKHLPRYAMLSYETRGAERYRVNAVQERIEANWWSDPTMLPVDWLQRDRREMADYLLNGRAVPGGPPDMRYFFYTYRVQQIDSFAREAWERVQQVNKTKRTKIGVSAAVFKNPIQSARFIGQQWDEWTPWISIFMPMTYRSHFAGSFDAYLDHLTETTARQKEWIGSAKPLYAGLATTYLFREEWQPVDDIRDRATELKAMKTGDAARAEKAKAIRASYETVRPHLANVAPDHERELGRRIEAIDAGATATLDELLKLITQRDLLRRQLDARKALAGAGGGIHRLITIRRVRASRTIRSLLISAMTPKRAIPQSRRCSMSRAGDDGSRRGSLRTASTPTTRLDNWRLRWRSVTTCFTTNSPNPNAL